MTRKFFLKLINCISLVVIIFVAIFIALPNLSVASSPPSDLVQAIEAMRKASVEREWSECIENAPKMIPIEKSEARCKQLISLLWEREKEVLVKIKNFTKSQVINLERFGKEMSVCRKPMRTYSDVIECLEDLSDRADEAIKGNTLRKGCQ